MVLDCSKSLLRIQLFRKMMNECRLRIENKPFTLNYILKYNMKMRKVDIKGSTSMEIISSFSDISKLNFVYINWGGNLTLPQKSIQRNDTDLQVTNLTNISFLSYLFSWLT